MSVGAGQSVRSGRAFASRVGTPTGWLVDLYVWSVGYAADRPVPRGWRQENAPAVGVGPLTLQPLSPRADGAAENDAQFVGVVVGHEGLLRSVQANTAAKVNRLQRH